MAATTPVVVQRGPVKVATIKRTIGRPSQRDAKRTAALAETICDRIAKGEALSEICDPEDPNRPCSYVFVWEWQRDDADFAKKFAGAREVQAEFYADECMRIADGARDRDSSAAARIQIDARLRRAAHLKPKTFRDDASPVTINNNVNVTLDEDTRMKLIEAHQRMQAKFSEKVITVLPERAA